MSPRWPALFHWGAVLLYGGIVAAGAARQDWRIAVPVGLAMLLLWTMLQRSRREWWGWRLPPTLLVQGALAAFVWLLGRWALAPLVTVWLPVWATAGISLLGVALGRAAWGRGSPAAMEAFLDDALDLVEGRGPFPEGPDDEPWAPDDGDDDPGAAIDLDEAPRR